MILPILSVIKKIYDALNNYTEYEDGDANPEAKKLYTTNKPEFERIAKEWTRKYAM
jgi:ubiquitin-protein ligase